MTVTVSRRPGYLSRTQSRPRLAVAGMTALALAALFLLLLGDALVHPRAAFDLSLLRTIQRVDLPGLELLLRPVDRLTSQTGAIMAWGLTLLVFGLLRWWPALLTATLLPLAAAADNLLGDVLVPRLRPSLAEVERVAAGTDPTSFPSGHVLGAVLLYGLLFIVLARVRQQWLRRSARAVCLVMILLVGPARLWYGAHWPSDVLAGYALGGLLLLGLVRVYRWLNRPRLSLRLLRFAWRIRRLAVRR